MTIGLCKSWGLATMIPEYDISRISENGLTWLEPVSTLEAAKARIQQCGAKEPGNYFIFDHNNRERIPMTVQPFGSG